VTRVPAVRGSVADVRRLLAAGADAILVGEALLKSSNLAARLAEFKSAFSVP
jgi:indole-3-glycerol phosphate synthase